MCELIGDAIFRVMGCLRTKSQNLNYDLTMLSSCSKLEAVKTATQSPGYCPILNLIKICLSFMTINWCLCNTDVFL